MAKARKKAATKKVIPVKKIGRPAVKAGHYFEDNELIGEDGMIVRASREQIAKRVILKRDIREAMNDEERNALDKKAFSAQLKSINEVLSRKDKKRKQEQQRHFELIKKVLEKKLSLL